jgi:predicted MFS family arabinose efflux permease
MKPGEQGAVRFTVVAAAALGLVWLGDALIYVVLPLYPEAFGIDIAAVGILLAVNRVIRIVGYGWVAPLSRRFGANALAAGACAAAAASTIAYGVATGFLILLVARLAWGASYGILYLTNMGYAYGDGHGAGWRLGLNRAVSSLGPVLALAVGGYLVTMVGPQQVFVVYGVIGLAAIPLALTLPALRGPDATAAAAAASHRWSPSSLNLFFFVIGFGADGVFTATLSSTLAGLADASTALVAAGLLLAAHRLIAIALALTSGVFVDRFDSEQLMAFSAGAVAAALALIALGHIYLGAAILLPSRALLAIVCPVVAVRRAPGDRIAAMSAYATWSDTGLALGPLVGTLALAAVGVAPTYAVLAIATGVALLTLALGNKRRG